MDEVREACRAQPKNLPLRLELGDMLLEAGDKEAALDVYREALRLKPSYGKARRKVEALEATVESSTERGLVSYESKAEEAAFWRKRGNDDFNKGKYEAAYEAYTKAIELLRREGCADAKLHTNRAACLLTAERWVPAAYDGVKSIELDPDWWKGYWYHGQALLGQLASYRAGGPTPPLTPPTHPTHPTPVLN